MNVANLFKTLSFGVLSNLSMSNSGDGTIAADKQPKIILHANEALIRLYSRFVLKEDDLVVEMYEHITTYNLKPQFAESFVPEDGSEGEKYRYIKDLHTPTTFQDDVIRVLKVYNTLGRELPLNNESLRWSVFTPKDKTLQVPLPIKGEALSVAYQAKHVPLNHETPDQEIELPETLMGAFTAYVASNVFTDMGGDENLVRGQALMARYETICGEVEAKDVISITNSAVSTLFEQRGFV